MTAPSEDFNRALGQYRAYLETLTWIQIDPRLRAKFGLSDVISQTLLEAYQAFDRVRALGPEEQRCWLRRMLLNNLRDEVDRWLSAGRDVDLERPLQAAAEASSCRLAEWLAAHDSTPSERLIKQERALRLAEALAQLPERQREAVVLQQWHGWKLAQIPEHLGCTVGAVAGLHAHGLARLRELLPDDLLE
jgi:RNA polymerase sigma-70 factor (ECF subfamily)